MNRTRLALSVSLVVLAAACATPASTATRPRTSPLAGASDIIHLDGEFAGAGGVMLFEQSWRPGSGEPRAAVVLMHGLKDHADRYATFAEALTRAGFSVHAFDLRGHAHSGGARVWVESFDEYLSDLDTFVKRVQQKEPGKPVFLFGHSMGGAIATLTVLEKKPQVAGLILSAAALKRGKDVSGFLVGVSGFLSAVAPKAGVLELDDHKFSRDPEVVAAMQADPLVDHEKGPARTGSELLKAMEKIGERAGELNLPLLVLHGEADEITNPDGSRELVQRASSKDKTLLTYPGLVHDLLHEPEKEKVQSDIRGWLEARTPAR